MPVPEQLVADVVAAARSGDRAAVDALVTACLPLVYNAVARAADDDLDVDDVVQETMLRLVVDLPRLRDLVSVRAWVLAIAFRQLSEARRQAGAHRARVLPRPSEQLDRADPGAEFVDLTLLQESLSAERREVAVAAGWIDPGYREVLSLWWLEQAGQLTRAEVAATLGEPVTHVAVRVQRMRAQLDTARSVVRATAPPRTCVRLDAVISGWDGRPAPLWRKRIARHLRDCTQCAQRSQRLVPAERLLLGIALLPVPAGLRSQNVSGVPAHPGTATSPGMAAPSSGPLPTAAAKVGAAVVGAAVAAGVLMAIGVLPGRSTAPPAPGALPARSATATAPARPSAAPVPSPSSTATSSTTPATRRPADPASRVPGPSTFSARQPALPSVLSLRQLGPVSQNARVDARDGGQSARYGKRSVWIFADTTLRAPFGFLSNSGAATTDLNAADGITLTSGRPATVDPSQDPAPLVPLTAAEKKFQKDHSTSTGCTGDTDEYCGAVFGFWPGPVVADPARGRVLFTYGKLCRGGAAGTECAGVKGLGVGIAAVDMSTGTVTRLKATGGTPVRSLEGRDDTLLFPDGQGFSAAALVVGADLYVYGDCGYLCRVARVPLVDVADRTAWRVRTDSGGWSPDLSSGVRLSEPGGAGQTVLYSRALKAYVNVFMPYGTTEIRYQVGGSPFGPWSESAVAGDSDPGRTATTGLDYALYAHPEYAQKDGLVQYLSYFRPGDGSQRLLRLEFEPG